MPELPMPLDYQQTLVKSFTLGGIGLHGAEYAVVRVRPAFAGEGRYFVRVPDGTNGGRFVFDEGSLLDEAPYEEGITPVPVPEEVEDLKVEWFTAYLAAQEEQGYIGTFGDFLQQRVLEGQLEARTRAMMLGLPLDDDEPDVEPDLSMEPEEIEQLDPSDPSLVRATIGSVRQPDYPFTQLGEGDNRVISVELLLAALEASGVDNARIEIEGGHEIPVLDNSALGWCIDIQCAGLRPAPIRPGSEVAEAAKMTAAGAAVAEGSDDLVVLRRELLRLPKAVAVQDEFGWISFFPGPFSKLTACADHNLVAPVIGTQWLTWHSDDVHFRYSLAPARAYAESVEELFSLREQGFVQAGAEDLFLIAAGDRWWDPAVVRMAYDEPVRYKLSQLVGNLSLLSMNGSQGIPVGHITAYNASPSLQLSFVQAMLEAVEEGNFTSYGEVIEEQAAWVAVKYGAFKDAAGADVLGLAARRSSTSVGGDVVLEYEDEDEMEEEEYEDEAEA